RPVAIPGEEIVVTVAREGKEPGQGVGSLDDGTMVVIQNGRRLLNQTITAVVTSVIQTSAGRMIFAEPSGAEPRRQPTRVKPREESAGAAATDADSRCNRCRRGHRLASGPGQQSAGSAQRPYDAGPRARAVPGARRGGPDRGRRATEPARKRRA